MTKTALDLTPQERQGYRLSAALEQREKREIEESKRRRHLAWNLAQKAAYLLKTQFDAQKVVVFGSLTHEKWFSSWSDIDLVAWGIAPLRFYAAVATVTGLSSSFKIDLVDIETCRPSLCSVIESDGIEL